MNKSYKTTIAGFASAACMFAGSMANAATVSTNSATIDWSSLSITSGSTALVESMTNWSSAKSADVWDITPVTLLVDSKNNITDTSATKTTSSTAGSGTGSAQTTAALLSASATATSSVYNNAFSSESHAQRSQEYQVLTSGPITFMLDYDLAQASDTGMGATYAYNRAWSSLQFTHWDGDAWTTWAATGQSDQDSLSNLLGYGNTLPLTSVSGTLSFTYNAVAGDYLYLEAGVDSRSAAVNQLLLVPQNPVPLPGAAWLLGPGLLGLLGIRRKK